MKIFCEICQGNTISNRNCKKCGEMICSVCCNFKPQLKNSLSSGTFFKNRTKTIGRERLYMAIMVEVLPDNCSSQLPPSSIENENVEYSCEWMSPGVCGKCFEIRENKT